MAQTREGARKAAETMRKRYGEGYYKRLSAQGNAAPHRPKGFATNPTLARIAGAKGGRLGKRGKSKKD